jgi:hypothetical protein
MSKVFDGSLVRQKQQAGFRFAETASWRVGDSSWYAQLGEESHAGPNCRFQDYSPVAKQGDIYVVIEAAISHHESCSGYEPILGGLRSSV